MASKGYVSDRSLTRQAKKNPIRLPKVGGKSYPANCISHFPVRA